LRRDGSPLPAHLGGHVGSVLVCVDADPGNVVLGGCFLLAGRPFVEQILLDGVLWRGLWSLRA